jgi:hypothetical protein
VSGGLRGSGDGRRFWKRSEGLEEVEGSGGSTARSSGDGRKLWRMSKAPEAASTKLWSRHEALEAVEGYCGGSRKLWKWSKTVVEVVGSSGAGRELWRQRPPSGGGSKVWRCMPPIAYSSPTRRCLRFISCSTSCSHRPRPPTILFMPAILPAIAVSGLLLSFPLNCACGGGARGQGRLAWRRSKASEAVGSSICGRRLRK